jgi:ribonucleotide reductase beta subunit family protein with ferritin-like domain
MSIESETSNSEISRISSQESENNILDDLSNLEDLSDLTVYTFFPINYPILHNYYKSLKNTQWVPEEIDFAADRQDWDRLDKNTRRPLKFVLGFFAPADGLINKNLVERFVKDTSFIKEAGHFYAAQAFNETIHNETYSLLIKTLIRNPEKEQKLYNSVKSYPVIGNIARWMLKWMSSDRSLPERIIAFACIEGVLFSGAFCLIYWVKRRNILEGLCKANEWIARDEAVHTEFAVALYHCITSDPKFKHKPVTFETAKEIIDSAISVSEQFVRTAIRKDLVGLNADDMTKYIKCTANSLFKSLGFENGNNSKLLYDVENPFKYMAIVSLPNKTNFFESRVSEYSKVTANDGYKWNFNSKF